MNPHCYDHPTFTGAILHAKTALHRYKGGFLTANYKNYLYLTPLSLHFNKSPAVLECNALAQLYTRLYAIDVKARAFQKYKLFTLSES